MQEEEYTDYSCSTAIERLSRDVETVLRTWHVDRGSDHHVTVTSSTGSACSVTSGGGDADLVNIRLIRSTTLAWNLTVTTQQYGRSTITIDLELALWDTPGGTGTQARKMGYQSSHNTPSSLSKASSDHSLFDGENHSASRLVRSLRRKPFGEMPVHDFLFDNFSTLFGIGQHISLTPIQPHPLPLELLHSVGESILQRHDGHSTARWVLASTLSGWLQTALNIATANCHTCIPTFGVWGQYRPNELVISSEPTPSMPLLNPGGNSVNGSEKPSKSTPGNHSHSKAGSASGPLSQSSPGGKAASWGSAGDGPDALVGRTIRTEKEQEMQRQRSFAGNLDRDAYKRKGGVQLFPHWAQAIKKLEIPSEVLLRTIRGDTLQNQQFSPPFVVGHVLTPMAQDDSQTSKRNNRKQSKSRRNSDSRNNSNIPLYHIGANLWISAFSTTAHTHGNQSKNMPSAAAVLAKNARLAVWAGVLLQHCPEDAMVVLTGARHVFGWLKERNKATSSRGLFSRALDSMNNGRDSFTDWRMGADEDEYKHGPASVMDMDDDEFVVYRKQCQQHVQDLLQEAWGCKERNLPLWGSVDDPVAAVYATTTWSGKPSGNRESASSADNAPVVEPLLTFPLRIRSRRELSKRDWAEMEESVEKTILDPTNPSRFCIQTYYDRDTSVSTLAATQRCVLAAMIRAATLPNETLVNHLTDVDLVSRWDDDAGRHVARKLAERSNVGNGTKHIVDAMDWSAAVEELISVREAEYVVHAIMNGDLSAGFPSSPEECFNEHDVLSPFRKSAPWGRLLSVLFAHMARLRALSSVALVWRVFCQELRRRWDCKESLPNMQYVAGLDPHPLELYEKRSFSTIGLRANFAAFLNCTEPDPDDFHCLIGQKLQVFNLGVECVVACELLENEALEQFLGAGQVPASLNIVDRPKKSSSQDVPSVASTVGGAPEKISVQTPVAEKKKWPKANVQNKTDEVPPEKTNYGPPTIDRDLDFWVMDEPGFTPNLDEAGNFNTDPTDDTGFDYVGPPPSDLDNADDSSTEDAERRAAKKQKNGKKSNVVVVEGLPDQTWEGAVMDGSDGSVVTKGSFSQAYFDAAEAGSIFSTKNGFVSLDTVVNVADMKRRPGARCPVHNAALSLTGDQLYAPYLQRPYPITDDVALERRIMLAKSFDGEEKRGSLQARLEIAQRLQKPKLLSDMSAFKAANPKCTIDDFVRWYGNPGSPLDDYNDDPISDEASMQNAYQESAAKKLDKASEAMRVLVSTRDFWGKTWEEAMPIPAAEQEPLFDFSTTVEMVLDYLEQLHPANLMNQIMGVNLSSAYFALASTAKGTMKIGIVQLSMKRLRQKIERALELLSRDATGTLSQIAEGGSTAASTTSSHFATEETICACEDACNALSVAETMVARATSLLHKFPGQYKLISDILRFADGSPLALVDPVGRTSFLNLIHDEQQRRNKIQDPSKDKLPNPLLREYVFRNLDDENPCQLAVRFGDEGTKLDEGGNEGGVLLALMKSNMEDKE
mmetsp:Transcript_18427/g.29703  ORF Transcript_18427/g.29703 Transcript_18427/m.29703 type:complete len:1511 (+) Transcript_18427:284-4816(+)|eukprot:CAMPEP_0178823396 /NCGR_PEP_ID=MMETSP0746-20121128/5114_1 /TAXON_ID=913974 /ORGANISM="Nitzschia punctata, Strain CCMP561" /LENGTH=1510 /DNA_ID=CAMNT_0020484987 /DNA_START=185 /DNA_END=4717 /DNA_ORIENTATION=-